MADNKTDNEVTSSSDHSKAERNNRILIIILGILCGLTIILLSLVLYFSIKKDDAVCLTRDCTLTAASLISAMDHTVDPCEDFYKFTCADFIRKNPVPQHKTSTSVFFQYADTLLLQLKDLIENYIAYKDPDVVTRMQEAYHVCINTSYNSENEFAALTHFIDDVYDSWPIVHGRRWKSKFERLDDYIANILSHGIPFIPFVYIFLEEDTVNGSTKETIRHPAMMFYGTYLRFRLTSLIHTNHPKFKRDMENEENKNMEKGKEDDIEIRKKIATEKFLKGFLKLFGNPDEFEVVQEIQKMEAYASYTQEIQEESSNRAENSTQMSIGELTEATNHEIDWLKIINSKFHGKYVYSNSSKNDHSRS